MKKILITLLILLMPVMAHSADEWDKTKPQNTDAKVNYPTAQQANNTALDRVLSNYREGMKLTYTSATTVTVSAGEVVCSNTAGTQRRLRSNPSSTNVTFANIDTGAEGSSTTYYLYSDCTADANTATFKISLATAEPDSAITHYKRLGSLFNNSSSDMEQITNDNDNLVVTTGTIADAATISVPSGFSADECDWSVSLGDGSSVNGGSHPDGVYFVVTVNSSRVVTCTAGSVNVEADGTCVANYDIFCHR